MYCPNCGTEMKDRKNICPKCGTILSTERKPSLLGALLKILVMIVILSVCTGLITSLYATKVMVRDHSSLFLSPEVTEEWQNAYVEAVTDALNQTLTHEAAISLVGALIALLVIFVILRLRKHNPLETLRVNVIAPGRLVTFFFFGAAVNILVIAILNVIPFSDTFRESYNTLYGPLVTSDSLPVRILSIAVVTPILEEIVFRGFAVTRLRASVGSKWAIVLSAVIFGLGHFANTTASLIAVAYSTVIGLIFAIAFEKYDSLIPSVLCHAGFNTVALLPSLEKLPILPLAAIAVAVAAFCVFRIFFCYPTFSDFLLFYKRCEPINETERRIVDDIEKIRSGESTPNEDEIEALAREWKENRVHASAEKAKNTDQKDDTNT